MLARSLLLAIAMIALVSLITLTGGSDGAAIVLNESSVSVSPTTPTHDGKLIVNATVVFVDATPIDVILKYSMCTASYCAIDIPVDMVRVGGTNVWTVTIGPFEKEDPKGDPFIDVKLHVVAKGNATDGKEDPTVDSGTKLIYFKEAPNDDGDGKDSPAGLDIAMLALIGSVLAIAIRSSRSRTL